MWRNWDKRKVELLYSMRENLIMKELIKRES